MPCYLDPKATPKKITQKTQLKLKKLKCYTRNNHLIKVSRGKIEEQISNETYRTSMRVDVHLTISIITLNVNR